jgi:(1->4)-alpha-D-glucan 1-alpha-D-glucosylmutase
VKKGAVEALRIDHPDGLYDPRAYFEKLQAQCGKPTYVLVEKIVAPFENLPRTGRCTAPPATASPTW